MYLDQIALTAIIESTCYTYFSLISPTLKFLPADFNDADITFRSSDNVLFKLHRISLATGAGVFPGPEFDATGEIVQLQEPAEESVQDLQFELLLQVAEAAEKYQVYSGKVICGMQFQMLLPKFAEAILPHAIKYDITKLIDACALCTCLRPISDVVIGNGYPARYILQWIKYHEKCREIIFDYAENFIATMVEDPTRTPNERSCAMAVSYWMHHSLKRVRNSDWLGGTFK